MTEEIIEKKEKKQRKRKPRIKCDDRVKLYEDGKYHWMYTVNLFKNPTVLYDVYWVLFVTMMIFAVLMFCIQACAEGLTLKAFSVSLEIIGITTAIFMVLGILGYLLYAAVAGGKYDVHFIMDENGVEHRQAPRSKKAAKRIGALTVLAGIASKRPGVVGAGMISASRTSMISDFMTVRKVKASRRINVIKVNERFSKNRVYVSDEDFDFVYDFICKHCPNAKIG